jgi:hypothetical protein
MSAEWTKGEGNTGTRKVTAFYPEADSSANGNFTNWQFSTSLCMKFQLKRVSIGLAKVES